jgi:hypothetical protein
MAGALEGVNALANQCGATCGRWEYPSEQPANGPAREGVLAHLRLGAHLPSSVPCPPDYWRDLGLGGFADRYRRLPDALQTAGCGPACPVEWEGPG